MSFVSSRQQSRHIAINREERYFERPTDSNGNYQRVTDRKSVV